MRAFILSTTLFWLLLHAVKHFIPAKSGRQDVLPLASHRRVRTQLVSHLLSSPLYGKTHFTLEILRFDIVTTGFSESHDALSWKLRHGRLAALTRTIYNVGAFLGALVSVLSVVALPWMIVTLSNPHVATILASWHPAPSTAHGKRSDTGLGINTKNSAPLIQPIVRLRNSSCA